MIPYRLILWLVLAAGAVAGLVALRSSIYHAGELAERGRWEAAAQKGKAATQDANLNEVIKYVDRIKVVERSVPVVLDRLVRVCDEAAGGGVPGAGEPAAAAAADAPDRRTDLAAELVAARDNQEQCRALMAVLRPQARAAP